MVLLNLNSAREAVDRETGYGDREEKEYRDSIGSSELVRGLDSAGAHVFNEDDPVARPGLAEVPTPFGETTNQLAFTWYLRRR